MAAAQTDTITYELVLTNTGNTTASNVTIVDAAPAGTTFVEGSTTAAAGTIDLGDDAGEDSLAVDIVAHAGAGNAVTVTSRSP